MKFVWQDGGALETSSNFPPVPFHIFSLNIILKLKSQNLMCHQKELDLKMSEAAESLS